MSCKPRRRCPSPKKKSVSATSTGTAHNFYTDLQQNTILEDKSNVLLKLYCGLSLFTSLYYRYRILEVIIKNLQSCSKFFFTSTFSFKANRAPAFRFISISFFTVLNGSNDKNKYRCILSGNSLSCELAYF